MQNLLPVLEQEEVSVCVILKKSALAWSKEMTFALIGFYKHREPFFQFSQHQEQERMGTHLHYAKHSQWEKNSSSSSP